MNDKKFNQLRIITLILMIFAAFFHVIQLFFIPFDFKWIVALTGFILYSVASIGVSFNKKFGYIISNVRHFYIQNVYTNDFYELTNVEVLLKSLLLIRIGWNQQP